MCYQDKLDELFAAVKPLVHFANVAQAEAYKTSWRQPASDHTNLEINSLAATMLLYAECEGCRIGDALRVISSCEGTRLSALRETIRRCAEEFLARREARIERELELAIG